MACSSVISRTPPPSAGVGMRMKRSILLRHADERVHRLAVAGAGELEHDREAEIGDERKRMRRIDRERRQHREDVLQEIIFQPAAVGLLQAVGIDQHDVLGLELLAKLPPARLLVAGEAGDRLADPQQSARSASARRGFASAMPARTCPLRPATRTMKNSSRLLAEIERKRTFSNSGCWGFSASSSTRRLKCSQDSSRLINRSGLRARSGPIRRRRAAVSAMAEQFLFQNRGLCSVDHDVHDRYMTAHDGRHW